MQSLFSLTARASVRWHDLPGQGIPVVFIHGLGCASSYEYPRIVADPAFGGRRAILIDLPGYGFSDKPRDYDYSIAHQADVVIEVVNALELGQCHIYGHSMGEVLLLKWPNNYVNGCVNWWFRNLIFMQEEAYTAASWWRNQKLNLYRKFKSGRNLNQHHHPGNISEVDPLVKTLTADWENMVQNYEGFFDGKRHIRRLFAVGDVGQQD